MLIHSNKVDVYDVINVNYKWVDWSDEAKTAMVLKLAFGTAFIQIFVLSLVPFHYIMLAAGVGKGKDDGSYLSWEYCFCSSYF